MITCITQIHTLSENVTLHDKMTKALFIFADFCNGYHNPHSASLGNSRTIFELKQWVETVHGANEVQVEWTKLINYILSFNFNRSVIICTYLWIVKFSRYWIFNDVEIEEYDKKYSEIRIVLERSIRQIYKGNINYFTSFHSYIPLILLQNMKDVKLKR